MEEIVMINEKDNTDGVRGYKVFNPDWTCSPDGHSKQYTCPGRFEENVVPRIGICGMHFCKELLECFSYWNHYGFSPENKVAEVIAYGTVSCDELSYCTDKLEIVREIPWKEVLCLVNTGHRNSGNCNSGNCNSGNCNSGDRNSGNRNSGDGNSGDGNSGGWNTDDWNTGNHNSGDGNSGNYNSGNCNSGNHNSGSCNSGNCNSGDRNSGNWNTGDWNTASGSSGCFMTETPKIPLFNRPSDWTLDDWRNCHAKALLDRMPFKTKWIYSSDMTEDEKTLHPSHKTTDGYLRTLPEDKLHKTRQQWWDNLPEDQKAEILNLPNFDPDIFRECTGICIRVKE